MYSFAREVVHKSKALLVEPIFNNAIYIIIDAFFGTFLGFIFWILCTRFYSIEQIGIMAALISAQYVITRIANLGFDSSIVRFLPKSKEKSALIWTTLLIGSILVFLVSIIYLVFFGKSIEIFNNNLHYWPLFIISTLIYFIFLFIEPIFLAYRKTVYNLFKNSLSNILKITLALLLAGLGFIGLFFAWNIAFLIPIIVIFFFNRIKLEFKINLKIIKDISKFSLSNYLSGFFATTYRSVLQYMVLIYLGAVLSAQFFFLYTLVSLIYFISDGFSQSVFVEGSYDKKFISKKIQKSLIYSSVCIIPLVIIFFIFWKNLFLLFGKEYTTINPISVYLLLATGILSIPYSNLMAFLKVNKRHVKIIVYNMLFFLSIISISFALISKELVGISIGILSGFTLITIFAFAELLTHKK